MHEAIVADFPDGFADYDIYASGPPAMVNAGFEAFKANGLAEDSFFSDAFEFQTPKAAIK